MSGLAIVQIVYNVLPELAGCVQSVYTAYCRCTVSELRKPCRSVQLVYENAFLSRLLAMTLYSAVSALGVLHLVYNALRDLPVCVECV